MLRGGSCIVDPLGRVLAGPLYDRSGIITADLDLDEIARGKFDFDVVGHYARPDIFRLVVNTAPTPAAVIKAERWPAEESDDAEAGPKGERAEG